MNINPIPPVSVAHELPHRLRLRCRVLKNPALDPEFFEATLSSISGVEEARINSLAGSVTVVYDGFAVTRRSIISSLSSPADDVFNGDGTPKTVQSILSLLTLGSVTLSTIFLPPILAAPIAVVLATPTIIKGIFTLWTRGLKVEVLDGTAVLFCLVRRDYFTAASIVFLLSAGEYIEELSENKSTGMLKNLLRPQVSKIWIEVDNAELEISIEDAKIGDRVICGAGELIPLDGKVVEGQATVNNSSISGESVPLPVEPGDEVLSGSVVEEGRIVFEASHVGSDTSMARITGFLENSLRFSSDSQRKSDELADKLVPITFGLGIGLLVVTQDLNKAAAVLTVDYSCAIKLTNPVAIRSAMVTAAGQGVLLKGSQAMDGLAKLDTLVFDKTGTLTHGQLQVTDIIGSDSFSEEALLILAASAEEHYSHPVASAVVHAAKERSLALSATSQVDFIVAHGVSAYIDGKNVLVGSRHFIETDEGIDCNDLTETVQSLQKEGKSLLYVARAGELAGVIAMRDELRAEANDVLNKLKESGIKKIVILTGDAKLTADALAAKIPAVDEVHSELKPEDKARIVKELMEQGCTVGFTGDGVNDAPALITADVGISLPDGSDIAKESAQVILLRDNLYSLLAGRLIAQSSQKTIQHCFLSTIAFNTSVLLLATFSLVNPAVAALLHNASTVGTLAYASARGKKTPNIQEITDNQETGSK